jgi:hypothetical protein
MVVESLGEEVEMEELATAIVDAASVLKNLVDGAGDGQVNVAGVDQSDLLQSISSIVQNLAAFLTELAGAIAAQL